MSGGDPNEGAARGAASASPPVDNTSSGGAGADAVASGGEPVIGGTGAARVVVLGWGNASRGDDGLGPLLLARVEALGLETVTTIEDFQLQLEHALDLKGADIALFLDAGRGTPAPFAFYETAPKLGLTHTSHAMAPEAVLDVYARVLGEAPPPAFVMAIRGEAFELGTELGEVAHERLDLAWDFLRPLIEAADVETWRAAVTADGLGG